MRACNAIPFEVSIGCSLHFELASSHAGSQLLLYLTGVWRGTCVRYCWYSAWVLCLRRWSNNFSAINCPNHKMLAFIILRWFSQKNDLILHLEMLITFLVRKIRYPVLSEFKCLWIKAQPFAVQFFWSEATTILKIPRQPGFARRKKRFHFMKKKHETPQAQALVLGLGESCVDLFPFIWWNKKRLPLNHSESIWGGPEYAPKGNNGPPTGSYWAAPEV